MNSAKPDAVQKITVGGRLIEVGHPNRIYFPDDGYTKLDVLNYYAQVASLMAKPTENRALSLRRFPQGIGEKGFFQKRVGDYYPDWIPRAVLPTEDGTLEYALGGDPAALVWLANLGTIEFHSMLSRSDRAHRPDQIIFDLDPPKEYTDDVRRAALGLKDLCDGLGLSCFVKTTGSRGFHVILPIERRYDFDETRDFAKLMAARLIAEYPAMLSMDMRKATREGRILVDVWRNGYAQTAVAPFSLRARPTAPVAVPLHWDMLRTTDVHPRMVTMKNYPDHAAQIKSAWPEKLGPASRIEKARRELSAFRTHPEPGA